ncbi:saccharopine dehydrogenase-like oxidoreductase [Macrosteles quadrilineatus]|uniref:saccharopine dehydrogenase-like oxidoreductase n=1 Tax=Macrosteles quadrilineatus TaxID=74068 RepID=UPI0023E1B793|nr:saccharopine dehydrogenase-like oxidoreductase [Macrosteles quadrilineatus]
MASSRLDIVIFGATGFTGKVAVKEILKFVKDKNITWGVAGRSEDKLKQVLQEVSNKTGEDLSTVPVIVADVKDPSTLSAMAARAKVVANCVGPYRLYGEPVVKACIENGTHHVDVSGEPQFMEKMQLEYNKAAEEKGVYVISACGFDSIPADMGLIYFIEKFNGEVNAVETYLESDSNEKVEGASIHYGTWESAVYGLTHWNELRPLRQKLYPERLPSFTPKLEPRSALHKSDVIGKWCTPFPGSDRPVMYRSQRFLYEQDKVRPVQVQAYIGFPNLLAAIMVILVGGIFALFTKTSFTRKLLLKHPKFFSFGFVSHEGPSEKTLTNTEFSITFSGVGWTEKAVEGPHTEPPNKTLVTKVSGRDPGYGLTTTALLLAGITIIKDGDKMPGKGGVLPPGAAFAKTSLIKDLSSYGLKFEVIKEDVKEKSL